MSDFFQKNRVADPSLAEDGVWVTGAYNGKLDVKVRRLKSEASQAGRAKIFAPYSKMRKIPEAKQDELNRKWIANYVLLSWRPHNPEDPEAVSIPAFSPNAAEEAFEADPDFQDEIVMYSAEAETFRASAVEEDRGNSENT